MAEAVEAVEFGPLALPEEAEVAWTARPLPAACAHELERGFGEDDSRDCC